MANSGMTSLNPTAGLLGFPSQNTSGSTQAVPNAGTNVLGQLATARNNYANSGFPAQPTPAPSTPVKNTTVTSPDGSSVSTDYHAPATSSSTSPATLPQAPVAPQTNATIPNTGVNNTGNTGYTVYNQDGTATNYNGATSTTSGATPMGVAQPQTAQPTTFGGIVGSLANTAQNGSQNATQATSGLLQAPNQNAAIGAQAQDIAAPYGAEIQKVSNYGNALAGGITTGGGLAPVSLGLAGAAQNTTANEVQGIQAAENAALAPIPYELTGQNQGQAGLTDAGSIANTQQSNIQSGLQQAGTLAQPSATASGQTTFNPVTGQFSGGSTGSDPTQPPSGYTQAQWNTIISNVANGVPNAISGLPTVLQAQAQAAAQAQNPNFNINTALGQAAGQQAVAEAPGSAQASNISTAGTAATSGTAASLQGTIGTYNNMSALNTTANSQAQTVQQVLQSTGLNQGVPAFTKPLNSLSGQLGSANVTALTSAITEMQNVYGQLLSSGGTTPTGSETQALALLSPNSTPEQINSAISQLQQAAYNKLNGQYSQLQTEQSALQSSNASGGSNANGTITTPYGTINPNL